MPFTPFHMGPGLLIKGLFQNCFSLMIFGWSQILMDIQPLIVLTTGVGNMHGFSHTFVGATIIAFISAFTGKWITEMIFMIVIKDLTETQKQFLDLPGQLKYGIVFISAFVGTYSHVLLDSLMHADITPFYPFTGTNRFIDIITVSTLYKLCVYTGLAGAGLYFVIRLVLIKKAAR